MNLLLTTLLTTSIPRCLSWGRWFFVVFLVGFQADIHFTNGNSNKALVLVNKALLMRGEVRSTKKAHQEVLGGSSQLVNNHG